MSTYQPQDEAAFAVSDALERDLRTVLAEHGIHGDGLPSDLLVLLTKLISIPNPIFDSPREYVRWDLDGPVIPWQPAATASHDFLQVLAARESRRDFADHPVPVRVLLSALWWTFGIRGTSIAYDYRGAPLRFVPSAGGLASVDAYVVAHRVDGLESGAYYVDSTQGLRLVGEGHMIHRLAASTPEQEWVAESAALVVFVANPTRVTAKYGATAAKLMLLDAGAALHHAELVCASHELRATILGGVPAADLEDLLDLQPGVHVPLATLAVGARPAHA